MISMAIAFFVGVVVFQTFIMFKIKQEGDALILRERKVSDNLLSAYEDALEGKVSSKELNSHIEKIKEIRSEKPKRKKLSIHIN